MEAQLIVHVISNDTVKPSCPTPLDRKTITLSYLDESFPTIHVPTLLIYTGNGSTKSPFNNITSLKNSLSETLTHFYPLAGRFENEYTVSCNDEGIPFFATRVNCKLIDYLNSPRKHDVLGKFLPPEDIASLGQHPISEVVPLAIQINFFVCGGVVIGCYGIHKLMDATSFSIFLNYWSAHASGRYKDLVKPDFDTIIRVFPKLPNEKRGRVADPINGGGEGDDIDLDAATDPTPIGLWQDLNTPIKVVQKSFKFNNIAIKKLKTDVTSETVPNPTSFEAVTGFVWKHTMDVVLSNNNDNNDIAHPIHNVLSFVASLRQRTSPPLPKQSMGNITAELHARVDYADGTSGDNKLKEIVRAIHSAIQMARQKFETLQGKNVGEAFISERNAGFRGSVEDKSCCFTVGSWCKMGFNNVNFGFGAPFKIIPICIVYPFQKNSMTMVDYCDSHGDGIEVFICLEDKHMLFLESNPLFMGFVTSSW